MVKVQLYGRITWRLHLKGNQPDRITKIYIYLEQEDHLKQQSRCLDQELIPTTIWALAQMQLRLVWKLDAKTFLVSAITNKWLEPEELAKRESVPGPGNYNILGIDSVGKYPLSTLP